MSHRTPPRLLRLHEGRDVDLRLLKKDADKSEEDLIAYLSAAQRVDGLMDFQVELADRSQGLAQEIEDHLDKVGYSLLLGEPRMLYIRHNLLLKQGPHTTQQIHRTLFRLVLLWSASIRLMEAAARSRDTATLELFDRAKEFQKELKYLQGIVRALGIR